MWAFSKMEKFYHITLTSQPLSLQTSTLKITNKKNGRMGQTITHQTVANNDHGPIIAIACRIHHILSQGGSEENLLCDYINIDGVWTLVTSNDLQVSLRLTIRCLQLHNYRNRKCMRVQGGSCKHAKEKNLLSSKTGYSHLKKKLHTPPCYF